MRLLFIEILLVFSVNGQLCDEKNTIDLTLAKSLEDGIIISDGEKFSPGYIYSRNDTGAEKIYGCLCQGRRCFRKCCPPGKVYHRSQEGRKCIDHDDIVQTKGLNVFFMNNYKKTIDVVHTPGIFLLYGIPCDGDVYLEDNGEWFIQEDGKLYVNVPSTIPPFMLYEPDKYCVDTFISENEDGAVTESFDALICFATEKESNHYVLSSTCMIISCVFILATVAVYGWLPELRNLHGRVLMAYLLCLFVGFAFLAAMQILLVIDNISTDCCIAFTIIIYFALESAFFWLNVMCFDIWWTFSGKRGMTMEKLSVRAKFCAYSIYAFGIPTALTVILVALEFSDLQPHILLPLIRRQGCFLFGYSKLIYLYGPMVILWFANLIFFILTAVKITQIKKQTSVLKSRESATHDRQNTERQSLYYFSRLFLYAKLFVVMGVNWLLEVISALYPKADEFWRFTDAYNVLIGLIIFIIFVCKRKIFRLMKKRYIQVRGGSLTKSQSSTRTYSTRDDIALNSRIN
ncbi:G-protein coupled receptor Mth2-like isoform X5 [Danaus plexippus]|uniref:G-protein coupled receptor Mth2-like isoform X5 n=1 Tax=Danaus plexippus TaxID=13037 RepID=UPI002AB12C4C|nr:G-protein coupled receptor Mth2-like isoform X5 [Danaus plexippus]